MATRSNAQTSTRSSERAKKATPAADVRERTVRVASPEAVRRAAKRITKEHRELIEDLAK